MFKVPEKLVAKDKLDKIVTQAAKEMLGLIFGNECPAEIMTEAYLDAHDAKVRTPGIMASYEKEQEAWKKYDEFVDFQTNLNYELQNGVRNKNRKDVDSLLLLISKKVTEMVQADINKRKEQAEARTAKAASKKPVAKKSTAKTLTKTR